MKYAIISDIHGNMPALEAVLKDAKKIGVNEYIFLGDYCLSSPFPNEVVNTIKDMSHAHVVRGNEEDYFENILNQDENAWINGQYSTLYWGYNAMTKDNLNYLSNLPKELNIQDSGASIRSFHSSKTYFNGTKTEEFTNNNYSKNYRNKPFTREEYINIINNTLSTDDNLKSVLGRIPDGIYTFGHTHVQWYLQIENKLLINPGSCGLSLDCLPGASYTIIDISNSNWQVLERRVQYDIEKAIDNLLKSELYQKAKVMSSIVIDELRTGLSQIHAFFVFIKDYANEINDTVRPYSQETWNNAYKIWQTKKHDFINVLAQRRIEN
jgi:Predicted phosphoesterase